MPPRRRPLVLLAAPLLALLAARAAAAADAWLLPTRSIVPAGVEAALDLAAMDGAGAIDDDAVLDDGRVRLAGRTEAFPAPIHRARGPRFRVPLRRAGIATLAVTLAPHDVVLDSAAAEARLRAVGAPDSVRRAFLGDGARTWRERRTVHAKAFVRVASPLRPAPPADSSWTLPIDAPLELVPEQDPTRLRAGDTLVVRVLRGGRPVYDFPVSLLRDGARGETRARTETWGRVALPLPHAGRWRLRAVDLRRAPSADDAAWTSDVATLVVVAR